jgi:PAS domain S-box-containing protein
MARLPDTHNRVAVSGLGWNKEIHVADRIDRLILDALTDPVLAVDAERRVVFANLAVEKLLGWTAEGISGQSLQVVIPALWTVRPGPLPVGRTDCTALVRHGKPIPVEAQITDLGDGRSMISLRTKREQFEPERQRDVIRYLRATAEAAARLGSRVERRAALSTTVETLVHAFDAAAARIWTVNAAKNGFELSASAGVALDSPHEGIAAPSAVAMSLLVDEAARRLEPIVRDTRIHQSDVDPRWLSHFGIVAIAGFPLVLEGELSGVITHFSRKPLTEGLIAALTAFIGIVSSSLHDMQMLDRVQAARAEAEDQRRRLQTVLDVLPIGVMLLEGQAGKLTYVNPAGLDIGARPSGAFTLKELEDILPLFRLDGRPYPVEERPLWRTLHHGQRVTERLRYRRPDGKDVVLDIATAPFPGSGGGAVSTYRDVTEQLRLESELADRAAQFKTLVDHLPVGVAYFDERGICRAANPPACRLMGRPRGEVRDVSAEELFARVPKLRQALDDCLKRRVHHEQYGVAWGEDSGSDGIRYIDWRFEPLSPDISKAAGVLALIIDDTHRKRAEMELERARDAAEWASRNKTQFLSAVSHDLRTPVNALSLQAELLSRIVGDVGGEAAEDLSELAGEILLASNNLIELINDLLDLTRFDSGTIEYHPTEFRLEEWLSSTLAPLKLTALAKGLEFRWSVDQPGRILRADRIKLGRVLVNLAGNAVKFTEEGEVEVSAGSTVDGWFYLSARDTGPGIPEDQRERIFDEFAQLRNTERDRSKGTGLGLAICKRLVEGIGGRLTVESKVGRGSRFTAFYPPDHLSRLTPDSVEPDTREWNAQDALKSPLSVLIVEDDHYSRKSLTRLLEHAGYVVTAVHDGDDALAAVAESVPTLVLLDLMLPGIDGVEVLRRLRQDFNRDALPVIVLSGDVLGERSTQLRALDVNGLLAKPVDFDELLKLLSRVLEQRAGVARS